MPTFCKAAFALLSSSLPIRLRSLSSGAAMSHSKYEYVRGYEVDDRLLPNCWIVVRVDGKNLSLI